MRLGSIAVLLFLTSTPDLDVAIPAGSPLEWIDNIPSVTPDSYRGSIPRKADKDSGTVVVPEESKKPEATNIFNYVKVITWDLPGHLRWYGEMPRKPDEKTVSTGGGIKITIEYPPQVPPDLFWLASATFLRKLLHPAELNDAETIQYLIYLGEPSLMASDAAKPQPGAKEFCEAVNAAVTPLPQNPPSFDKAKGDYENMMIRLTFEDLVTDFPFSLEQRFCARIGRLGDEPLEYVIRAAKNTHAFLRRNAVFQLGRYTSAQATEELRKIYLSNKDEDPVVRNRALEALAKRRDVEIVPELIRRVKGDRHFRPTAIYALGLIGSPDGVKAVYEHLRQNAEDFDTLTSAIIALGRMRASDNDAVVRSLESLAKSIASKNIPDPQATLKPDLADPPNTRRTTIQQLVAIALANLKPEVHAKAVYEMIEASKKAQPPTDPRAGIFGSRYAKGILREINPMAVNFLLDTLPKLDKGKDYLMEIVKDTNEDESARSYAMFKLATATYDAVDEFVKPYLDIEKNPAPLVENALQAIFRSNRKTAVESAKAIVAKFLSSPAPTPGRVARPMPGQAPRAGQPFTAHQRFVTALCLKILGSLRETDPKTLAEVIKKEVPRRVEQKKADDAAKNPPPPPPGQAKPPFNPAAGLWQMEFNAPDYLLEYALIELGRLGDKAHIPTLCEVLDNKEVPARAEACLALGAVRHPDAVNRLVAALEDEDGWVRFMAYRCLKEISGEDHFCDWIYEPPKGRQAAVDAWKKWARK